jgi:hypothetical protein
MQCRDQDIRGAPAFQVAGGEGDDRATLYALDAGYRDGVSAGAQGDGHGALGGGQGGGGADYVAPDETDTALLKALDRIAQRRRREALVRADARQEFERAVLAGERPGPVP